MTINIRSYINNANPKRSSKWASVYLAFNPSLCLTRRAVTMCTDNTLEYPYSLATLGC